MGLMPAYPFDTPRIPVEWAFETDAWVVSNDEIIDLRSDCVAASDALGVAICERALKGYVPYHLFLSLPSKTRKIVEFMSEREAREYCAALIRRNEDSIVMECS
jgi:hypothetical protein